mmetsp:Transcript_35810/g.86441  ORF Transcript_35810/g.86441 Transcript_35810/m.86441 type:complete len:299 (+) Transcript_35810:1299-2195(+)
MPRSSSIIKTKDAQLRLGSIKTLHNSGPHDHRVITIPIAYKAVPTHTMNQYNRKLFKNIISICPQKPAHCGCNILRFPSFSSSSLCIIIGRRLSLGRNLDLVHLDPNLTQRLPVFHVQRPFDARPQPHTFDFLVRILLLLFQFGREYHLGNIPETTVIQVVHHAVDARDGVEGDATAVGVRSLGIVLHAVRREKHPPERREDKQYQGGEEGQLERGDATELREPGLELRSRIGGFRGCTGARAPFVRVAAGVTASERAFAGGASVGSGAPEGACGLVRRAAVAVRTRTTAVRAGTAAI